MTRGTGKYHIIRATLDSIAYQVHDVLRAMEADAGLTLEGLRVDGGAAANGYLMQTQADINGSAVLRPRSLETTAMGAAFLAGLAVGYWANTDEIRQSWAIDREFTPEITSGERQTRLRGWEKAVYCAKQFQA